MSGEDDDVVIDERLAFAGEGAFLTVAARGEGAIAVMRARPEDDDADDAIVVTGDAYPEQAHGNAFVVLGLILPLGSTALDLVVREGEPPVDAQVLLHVDAPDGGLLLDVEDDDADEPFDGWEVELGDGGAYAVAAELVLARTPSRAVLTLTVAPLTPPGT